MSLFIFDKQLSERYMERSNMLCGCFSRRQVAADAESVVPLDVKEVFKNYSDGGSETDQINAQQLLRFLVDVQSESQKDAEWILEQVFHEGHHIAKLLNRQSQLTLDHFRHYLFSPYFNPPIANEVHQDMKAPLSHYFIYTGHNSYLTGNQLSSESSDVPIIKAMKLGVRAVELDIWPNSTKDDVHVLHGWTLTTPVELIKCLKSIKEHAFSTSPYPVIITLEDHLTPHLQTKVAKMVDETFGEMLFCPESECLKEFPSPEELKYRVVISTKPPNEYVKIKSRNEIRNNSRKQKDSDEDEERVELSEPANHEQKDYCMSDSDTSEQTEYKRLIAIHAEKLKGSIKKVLKIENDMVRRLSLSEQALEKATISHGTNVVRFTQKNLLRIYPKGTRFDSSNYNPMVGWMHGAQMVAFNMQGYGKYLWQMHGMFRSNGGCGYVKKPDFLMKLGQNEDIFYPKAKLPVKKTLKVKVYRGDGWDLDFKKSAFDLHSPPDSYIKIGIAGVPADKTKKKKTKTKENTWIPTWDEEFTFPLTVPELALLRIQVQEHRDMKDDFRAQTCLLVSELKRGIRAVPLFNHKGVKYESMRLLMRFEFV